jgi:hypothetical protein
VVVSPVVGVVDVSELGGAVVVTGVVDVVVVAAGVVEGVSVQPAAPAAPIVGVVDSASTVASVWVWVRPGGGFGVVVAFVLVFALVVAVGFAGGAVLWAVVALASTAAGLCAFFLTTTWRWITGWDTGAGRAGVEAIVVWMGGGAAWLATVW